MVTRALRKVHRSRLLVSCFFYCIYGCFCATTALVPESTAVPLLRRILASHNEPSDQKGHAEARLFLAEAIRCISNGLVSVDGVPCTDPLSLVSASNYVVMRDAAGVNRLMPPHLDWYLKFYKPRGVISAQRPDKFSRKPTTADFFPLGAPSSLHHAGRLDGDSEGILLLTTDGHFSHFVTSPGKGFEKEYIALTNCAKNRQPPSKECLNSLVEGIVLSDGHVARAKCAEVTDFDGRFARLRLVVTEGRFRMVRRMMRGVGYCCMQLLRVRTCGLGDAALRPACLQEAAKEALEKPEPQVKPATLAKNSKQLHPGEFAPLAPDEVAGIYAGALSSLENTACNKSLSGSGEGGGSHILRRFQCLLYVEYAPSLQPGLIWNSYLSLAKLHLPQMTNVFQYLEYLQILARSLVSD